jgi:hypothetical protein
MFGRWRIRMYPGQKVWQAMRRVDMGKARAEELGSGPGKGGRAMAGGRDHSWGSLLDEAVSPKSKKR